MKISRLIPLSLTLSLAVINFTNASNWWSAQEADSSSRPYDYYQPRAFSSNPQYSYGHENTYGGSSSSRIAGSRSSQVTPLGENFSHLNLGAAASSRPTTAASSSKPRISYLANRSLSLRPTSEDIIAKYPLSGKRLTSTPSSIAPDPQHDDWNWFTSVENQGDLGTCASFSVVEGLKFVHGRLLSQPYMITKAETEGDDCLNDGLPIGAAMQHAHKSGVIGQSWWNYDEYRQAVGKQNPGGITPQSNVCPLPPYKGKEEELIKYGFKKVKSLFAFDRSECEDPDHCDFSKKQRIKEAMHRYEVPVSVSVPVQENKEWGQTGRISSFIADKVEGHHAITLYEADDSTQTFKFKNSWGTTWGIQGHGTISYDYINNNASEAWVGYGKALRA